MQQTPTNDHPSASLGDGAPLRSTTDAASLGRKLRSSRVEAGMSQRDVERASGIPKHRISRYENGHLLPTITTLRRITRALGMPDTALLGEGDEIPPVTLLVAHLERRGVHIETPQDAEAIADAVVGAIRSRP